MEELKTFPSEILRNPQPLISLYGLDVNKDTHKKIWEVFTHNRSSERYSLHFNNLSGQGLTFPTPKAPKTSYEWYSAKGVLKKHWINKYQNVIPSVIVLFEELDWNDPEIETKTRACAAKVAEAKEALRGRGTKIAVILIQGDKSLGSSDSVTSFCTECEISPRSLFVIGIQDSLLPTIIRLETSLHELSQNFYHLEIKNVRAHNEALNKSTHLLLMVRHMFKIGYFNEMKSDLHSAQKAYQTSYALLMEAKLTDFNLSEFRTVAGYISYKICRLAFKLNLPRDAVAQFRRHLNNYKSRTGVPELGWEHAAWQSLQAEMFADLFLSNGGAAPGVYYQLAADYAISRRKLAEEQCSQIQSYPTPDPLLQDTVFYGQRLWRSGKIEAVDMAREKEGVEALQYHERTRTKHCSIITKLHESSIEQYREFKSLRMMNHVQVQMADELLIDQKHARALDILTECAKMYRAEAWSTLATACLLKAIKCAFLIVDVSTYLSLCLSLTSSDSECNDSEKSRIEQNMNLVLEGKPPLPEPSLTGKNERALVGQATKQWKVTLEDLSDVLMVPIPPSSSLDVRPSMPKEARLGDPLEVSADCINLTNQQVKLRPSFRLGIEAYNREMDTIELEARKSENVVYKFNLRPVDVGKKLAVSEVEYVLEHSKKFAFHKNLEATCDTIIVPRESKIDVKYLGESPALVGEWFHLNLNLESREENTSKNLEVLCWLRDGGDPLISDTTCLSTFPGYPASPTTPGGSQTIELIKSSATVAALEGGASTQVSFYLSASTPGSRVVSCQLRYTADLEGEDTLSSCATVMMVEVVLPFTFSYTVHDKRLDESKAVFVDEYFSILPKLACSSPHQLIILDSRLDTKAPVELLPPTHSLSGCQISETCTASQLFPARVETNKLITMKDQESINLGKFHLKWRRFNSDIENESSFELAAVHLVESFLGLTCSLPGFGVLRSPVTVLYRLQNKTEALQEYSLVMEPSDSFVFSGPKQLKLKVFPRDETTVRYLLHPLMSGSLPLPRLKVVPLTSAGVPSLDKVRMLEELISRSVPTHFFVLPQDKRGQQTDSAPATMGGAMSAGSGGGTFELKETVVVPNLGFTKHTVKTNC